MLDEQEKIYVLRSGRKVKLSYIETKALSLLIENKKHITRYAKLVKAIYRKDIAEQEDIVRVWGIIERVKEKVGTEIQIKTVRRIGYKIAYKE